MIAVMTARMIVLTFAFMVSPEGTAAG